MKRSWDAKRIAKAKTVLAEHETVVAAIPELQKLCPGITEDALRGAFRRLREASPASFCKPAADRKSTYLAKLERRDARHEADREAKTGLLLEKIEAFTDRVFAGRITANSPPRGKRTERIITLVLSDLHFGADLRQDETGVLEYGPTEEARRLAHVVETAREYKSDHRQETVLEVLLLGDIIQNQLHDPRDGAVLAEQCCRAIHLLSQAVARLAAAFPVVRVRCVSGNHGRNTARHLSRATFQKHDSHETVIYYALSKACSSLKNVAFEIPKTPYVTVDLFGKKVFATHGDTVLRPGNPGKMIHVSALESQINRINATLRDRDEYAVVVMGHIHTATMTHLPNGTVVVTNGALIPSDNYAVSIGFLETVCGQWLWESVPGFPVGDARIVRVDSETDFNSRLDRVIQPWKSYDQKALRKA